MDHHEPLNPLHTAGKLAVVAGAVALLLYVAWLQFLAPVGSFRMKKVLPIPRDVTERLLMTGAEIQLMSDDGRVAKVREWTALTDNYLRLQRAVGKRRHVTYTELVLVWPDGKSERARVRIDVP